MARLILGLLVIAALSGCQETVRLKVVVRTADAGAPATRTASAAEPRR